MPSLKVPCTRVAVPSPAHSDDMVRPDTLVAGWPALVTGILIATVLKAGKGTVCAVTSDKTPTVKGAAPTAMLTEPLADWVPTTAAASMRSAPAEVNVAGLTLTTASPCESVNAEPEAGVNSTS